ncbi:fibro-slime domain-containing protein [uncultured Ruminococcus sp.]|uniref:fibro-slime domain-containing protein n=1 Tax=uncultured Ruminococcus sp. TaxID=165186 RepID=UPI0025881DCA|nr:fibro-slime domain-containing protein [uncultured Ruminococcus sp.]
MKEKIKRISSSTWALILALMMVVSSFSVLAATTNVEKTGAKKTTVYFVPASQSDFSSYLNSSKTDIDSKYTVKLNLHYGSNENDPWGYVDVTKSSDTFGGNSVYISKFTDKFDGLAEMQIQIYDGETQKKLVKPITTWTDHNVYNGKVYDNGSWKTYKPDAQSVATSVSLDADNRTINVGESVTLTATANTPVSGELTYTFTETTSGATTTPKVIKSSNGTAQATFTDLSEGEHKYKVEVSANGYSSVTSDPITITVNKKAIASSVSLSADNAEIVSGNTVTLTADVKDPALTSGLTYTFTDTTTNTTQTETTNKSTFTLTTTGKHEFTVTVSAGDNYTTVEDTATVTVVALAKNLYLVGDFAGVAHWNDRTTYTDYPFTYENGKYVLKNVPFTGSKDGDTNYSFFRIYNASDKEMYSTSTGSDQLLVNGVTAKAGKLDDKALKFPASSTKRVNIEFDLEKLQITVTEVVVKYKMNAKYQISDTGSAFQDEVDDENIATVNNGLTATGSTGSVKAVNSFEDANGNTYVFSKWVSTSGTFANATSKETIFTPTSDGDVIAQYKRQYKVTCTTPTNGTLTASTTGPLAGDSYTITVKPADGYELASLMVYLGTPETTGNDITPSVKNGTYTTTAVNNARYVATFSKKKVDYSKYRLIGHFDSNNTWTYADGRTFNEDGECTFTLEGTSSGSSGGNGQFRFSDGTNDYGVKSNVDLQMNTEYTPTKGQKAIYYLYSAGAGTYKVTITKIASDGTPSFKIVKDASTSPYELMSSTEQSTSYDTTKISSVANFKTTDDEKVVSMTLNLNAGIYNFFVRKNNNTNYCSTQLGTLGYSYGMNRNYDSQVGCVQYNLSAGLYTVTYTIESDNYGKLKIDSVAKPLADSVTLSAAQTSVTAGKSTTITATLNNSVVPTGKTYTYKYYDDKGNELATKTSKSTSDSITVTSSEVGTVTYYVTVSTDATYEDSEYENTQLSYADVSSEGASVSYVAKAYYMAEVNGTTVGDRSALTQESFPLKDGKKTITLSFFNDQFEISEDTVEVMTVDESKNKYCQIIKSNIEDSAVPTGIPTYKIVCNEGAKDPVVYVKNGHIYAVASLDTGATSKTFASTEKVTYYFAEPKWATSKSNPSNGKDGLRIKYWNNSVPTQNGFIDVTTPVASDGTVTENGTKNTIYVKNTDFVHYGIDWSGWNDKIQTYYVYKVDLPVWATSFQFVTSGEATMKTVNGVVKDTSVASMGLNPNRIYMFFDYGNGAANQTYARGVVLDSSFWTNDTTRKNNDVATKNFKTNAVNYATSYGGASINNVFNKNLNALYDSSYSNPLFFGYLDPNTTQVAGNKNFRIQDNLAMRINNNAYYASVQGLAGSKLSTTQNNENGYAYLQTADNASVMPLFDYASLKKNSGVASQVFEKLNFPFNESNYNGVTTYSYDSYTDKNREVSASKKDFAVTTYKTATASTDKGVGFFPFEQFTGATNTHKYGFGTEFDIDFYMSETGRLETTDGLGKDITFNFSGDDDVWVYVDGVLVLDLGGAHKASSGSINFSTMEVIYKAAVDSSDNINSRSASPKTSDGYSVDGNYVTTVDLAKLFAANGVEFNNTSSSKKHTLQMFYMERGSIDSNCSISFNLPQNTGLLVRNDVNFDSVNDGLKDITMGIANKDYFSYSIGNKIATDTDISNLRKTFGDSSVPDKATSFDHSSFATAKPQYPVKTTNNVIRRVINGKTYYLAVKYTGDGTQSSYYWGNLTDDQFTPVTGVNYSLPDDFAMIEKDETANDDNGTTAVSGRVNDGVFNLLFNESASFDSKTPSNTLLKVVQNDDLYNVNAGSETEAMSCVAEQTDRKVKDYYTTSYTITDDKSQKTIGSRERQVNDGDITADDTSAVDKAFYFADYSEDKSKSSAMTVNFTNYVTTDKIKISKNLTDETKVNNDHFTFVVKLSNIFGDSSYADKQEYEGLTYDIYDKTTNTLKTTRTYGKSGVSITANEYAIITGVPVGTSYEVYEKTRSGYEFDNATAAFEIDSNNNLDAYKPTISSSTVTGTLPTITASGSSTEPTLHLTYTNKKVAFTISFKYYDREVTTGKVAHIATTPTVKNVSFDDISNYKKGSDTEGYYYDFAEMIADAMGNINVDNVIDSYVAFPSQSKAESAIKNQLSYRDFDNTTSTYKKYIEAYPNGNFSAHTDYYGRLQGSKDAKVSDGEDWVTYYNGNKKYATEEAALQHTSEVTSISVWYFNTLKTYSPTFHFATAIDDLSQIGDTNKFVANKKTNTIKPVFYNVRLGIKNDDAKIDSQGTYLEQYGVNGFTNSYSGTSMSIKDTDKELKFLYWSYDEAGKSIASNSYKYGYRVTNNIHLYAIYGDAKDNTNPGLTVSMNSPDYYIDNNGINRVRLNTMMNVYNCPDSDQKIRQVSVIYLQDPNNHISNYIGDNNTEALNNVRTRIQELIKEQCKKESFTGITIKIDGTHDNLAKGLTYKVWNDDGTSLLTNKNRVQFTTSFKQSSLGGENSKYKNLYTFAAMNYKESDTADDNWLISDNYIKYTFDANGKVTNSLTQVNRLQ